MMEYGVNPLGQPSKPCLPEIHSHGLSATSPVIFSDFNSHTQTHTHTPSHSIITQSNHLAWYLLYISLSLSLYLIAFSASFLLFFSVKSTHSLFLHEFVSSQTHVVINLFRTWKLKIAMVTWNLNFNIINKPVGGRVGTRRGQILFWQFLFKARLRHQTTWYLLTI